MCWPISFISTSRGIRSYRVITHFRRAASCSLFRKGSAIALHFVADRGFKRITTLECKKRKIHLIVCERCLASWKAGADVADNLCAKFHCSRSNRYQRTSRALPCDATGKSLGQRGNPCPLLKVSKITMHCTLPKYYLTWMLLSLCTSHMKSHAKSWKNSPCNPAFECSSASGALWHHMSPDLVSRLEENWKCHLDKRTLIKWENTLSIVFLTL